MTCSLRVKLNRIGIFDPVTTVMHCAELDLVSFPVPMVTKELDKRSTGAKRKRHNFQSKKERNDYYNGLKKLREALGERAMA